ncbi:MAG TPA: DUF962 domain-containing protein [Blastocatellia bacterium]|nr:DUF962 domain-containing protein [Blastocatellia bacterium]
MKRYNSFADFYPFYLSEHSRPACRRLHLLGNTLVIATIVFAVATRTWWSLAALPVLGYGCAWIGHFFFQKNRPATFTYPLYSFIGDWVMTKDVVTGKIRF